MDYSLSFAISQPAEDWCIRDLSFHKHPSQRNSLPSQAQLTLPRRDLCVVGTIEMLARLAIDTFYLLLGPTILPVGWPLCLIGMTEGQITTHDPTTHYWPAADDFAYWRAWRIDILSGRGGRYCPR